MKPVDLDYKRYKLQFDKYNRFHNTDNSPFIILENSEVVLLPYCSNPNARRDYPKLDAEIVSNAEGKHTYCLPRVPGVPEDLVGKPIPVAWLTTTPMGTSATDNYIIDHTTKKVYFAGTIHLSYASEDNPRVNTYIKGPGNTLKHVVMHWPVSDGPPRFNTHISVTTPTKPDKAVREKLKDLKKLALATAKVKGYYVGGNRTPILDPAKLDLDAPVEEILSRLSQEDIRDGGASGFKLARTTIRVPFLELY